VGLFAKVHPHYTLTYTTPVTQPDRSNYKPPKKHNHTGAMSFKQQCRIKQAVELLREASNLQTVYDEATKQRISFRLNFITVTLSGPQRHPDKYIMEQMFRPLLRWLNEVQGCKNYVWKAECQDNGNLHLHVTANKFVPWEKLRNKWNQLQYDQGYISATQNPNSTDVKAVRNEKQISSYLSKYISKKDILPKACYIDHDWNAAHFYKSPLYEWQQLSESDKAKSCPLVLKRIPECKLYDCTAALKQFDTVEYYDNKQLFEELWHLDELLPVSTHDHYNIHHYSHSSFLHSKYVKAAHTKQIERINNTTPINKAGPEN
jgi:hypothetical protein